MSYKFREGGTSGQWVTSLLPFCFLKPALSSNATIDQLSFAIIASLPVFHVCRRFIFRERHSSFESHYVFYALLSIPTSFILTLLSSIDIVSTYLICLVAVLSYNYLVSKLLIYCPGSFTVGEAQTIGQGIVVFVLRSLISLKEINLYSQVSNHTEAMDLLKLLLLGLLLLVCSLYLVPSLRNGLKIHGMSFGCAIVMILLWTSIYRRNMFLWFLDYCLYNPYRRIYLLIFWFLLTMASISYVVWINQKTSYKTTTLDRKMFHFIITAVFLSAVPYELQFLCYASGIALGAFIVLEMYRLLQVPFFGPVIEEAFKIFLDEKDCGLLILTHIYLLVGCSSSIWLASDYIYENKYHICVLSGIISVGFGDTFAAVGGTLLGKNRWKGSKRTVEGTICGILIQLICSFIFLYIGHPLSIYNIALMIVAVVLTSLIEAKTTQVDNLVLPLFMFAFLSWIQ